jgi:hypothetical protein
MSQLHRLGNLPRQKGLVMTKVLVAGATGNVGSRVVQELRGRDVSVRTLGRWPVDRSHGMIRGE